MVAMAGEQAATALAQAKGDDEAAMEVAVSCVRACAQSPSALKLPLVSVRLATALPAPRQLGLFRLTVEALAEADEGKLLKKLATSKEGAAAVLSMVDGVVAAAVATHVRPRTLAGLIGPSRLSTQPEQVGAG
jgi:hypothetical protein